jgi:hypothetical protein
MMILQVDKLMMVKILACKTDGIEALEMLFCCLRTMHMALDRF